MELNYVRQQRYYTNNIGIVILSPAPYQSDMPMEVSALK